MGFGRRQRMTHYAPDNQQASCGKDMQVEARWGGQWTTSLPVFADKVHWGLGCRRCAKKESVGGY